MNTPAAKATAESAAEAVAAESTFEETTKSSGDELNKHGKYIKTTDPSTNTNDSTINNLVTPDKTPTVTETNTQQIEKDRPELYIKATNAGSPTKISPTAMVCLTCLDTEGKLVAENVNQAVPDQKKLIGLLELLSTGKSGNFNEINDSQMHLHISKKPTAEDSVEDWEKTTPINASHMSLSATSSGARTSMPYGLPFTFVPELSNLVDVLNGDDGSGNDEAKREISEALTANVTTVKGQQKLLSTARKHNWLDERNQQVELADEDGVVGFGHFYTSFTAALKFYITAVEGNHRLLAILAALLRCQVQRESVFKPSNPGDETFLTKAFIGIEESDEDAMRDALEKLNNSDSDAILSHLLDAHITVAAKTATESFTATHLSDLHLHQISRNASKKKTQSTVPNIYRGLSESNAIKRDHEDWATIDIGPGGKLVYQGEEIEMNGVKSRASRTFGQFKSDPSNSLEPILQYHNNPMQQYENCQNEVKMKVGGGGPNDVIKLPVKINMKNFGATGNNPMTVEHNMNRVFPYLLTIQGKLEPEGKPVFNKKQIGAMVAGGVCAPRSAVAKIDRPKDDIDGEYDDTPGLFTPTFEGVFVTVTAAMTNLFEAAKLCNADDLLEQTINAFSIMAQTKEKADALNLRTAKCFALINVAAKEIATVLKKVKEDEGDVKRDVNVAALNFMVTMHLLHEYMHLIVSIPEDTQVDEELLSLDKQDLVGEAIREFLVERKDKEMTSNLKDQQLANRVIEAVRVMNETETGASSKERKSMQLTKGREVMGIITVTSDLTLVELICHIFCWNVVRAVEKADGDRTELKAFFFAKWGFTTTPNSVKESSQLMKVSKIGDAMVTSRIDSPNEFQLTGSLLSLRQLGDLFRGTAPLEDKLIQTYTIPKKSNAPTDDSSTLDRGKPTKRKRSKKKKKSDEHQSSDNNGSTTDTEETDAKKQRTNDCGNKTIVSQQSGNMTQHELHGLESKDKLIATAMEAAQKQVGSDVLAAGLLKNIATAIVNELFPTENEIDEMIASDDVMATNETTIEAVNGFDVGQPYNEQTGFFEVIKAAWRNVKWRAKHGQQHSMKKSKLRAKEEKKATNWEKNLLEIALKPAIKQIVNEMGKSIVFMTRREGKLVTKEYKVSEGDDNPQNTIYIYGEPTEDNSKCTIKNTKYYWMVPKE